LAPDAALDCSGVTRRASRLEAAGLIRREPNPSDRQTTLLVLTSSVGRVVTVLRVRLAAYIARSLESWPSGDAGMFALYLRRFMDDGPFVHPTEAGAQVADTPDRTPGN
jgi:DNA-binding MarR family transcriptional regulator